MNKKAIKNRDATPNRMNIKAKGVNPVKAILLPINDNPQKKREAIKAM